ncbi:MAG: manganese efflux pump [Dehalococcoidales bacterium]|nr:MAG: manganese efflux pump [Dehalococcoidales bacterium]
MEFLSVFLVALGLAADCFAVALSGSIAMGSLSIIQGLRTALAFGLFQGLMPVLGWLAGRTIVGYIEAYDHWLALGLLTFVGGKMIWESFRSGDKLRNTDITRGLTLVLLAVATSIDALAVGLTFAFIQIDIVLATLTIGLVSFVVTIIGLLLGKKVGSLFGKRVEIIGGLILIGIGLKIVIEHTM